MKTLEELKETLSSIEGKRDVERWNTLREEAKLYYPKKDKIGFLRRKINLDILDDINILYI